MVPEEAAGSPDEPTTNSTPGGPAPANHRASRHPWARPTRYEDLQVANARAKLAAFCGIVLSVPSICGFLFIAALPALLFTGSALLMGFLIWRLPRHRRRWLARKTLAEVGITVVLAAVLATGAWLSGAPGAVGIGPEPGQAANPPQTTTGAPVPAGRIPPCGDGQLALGLSFDGRTYPPLAAGKPTTFKVSLTNTSAQPCSRDVGRDAVRVQLMRYAATETWGSDKCRFPGPSPDVVSQVAVIQPHAAEVISVPWDGLQTWNLQSKEECEGRLPPEPGGQYWLRTIVGTKWSERLEVRVVHG